LSGQSGQSDEALVLPLGRRGTLLNGVDCRPSDIGGLAWLVLAVYAKNGLDQRAALVRRQEARMQIHRDRARARPERFLKALQVRHQPKAL
jgi:hypothetical protein